MGKRIRLSVTWGNIAKSIFQELNACYSTSKCDIFTYIFAYIFLLVYLHEWTWNSNKIGAASSMHACMHLNITYHTTNTPAILSMANWFDGNIDFNDNTHGDIDSDDDIKVYKNNLTMMTKVGDFLDIFLLPNVWPAT